MVSLDVLFEKYGDILREEINVKDLELFVSEKPITKIFKPVGSQLSAKFGKDTGQIIVNGKQGNVREVEEGIEVFNANGDVWLLAEGDYEVVYEGLEGHDISIDGNLIAKLDLEITPELEREGTARELSRFLNQMRKDADFPVDARVTMKYSSDSALLKDIVLDFAEFFKYEALLSDIISENIVSGSSFESQGESMKIILEK